MTSPASSLWGSNRDRRKRVRVLRCPDCRSTNIFYEAATMTGKKYKCGDCGYMGALVVEEDVMVDD